MQDKIKLLNDTIEKLKIHKSKSKHDLKVTRQNNRVLENRVDELKAKNGETESQLRESKAKIANGTNEIGGLISTEVMKTCSSGTSAFHTQKNCF